MGFRHTFVKSVARRFHGLLQRGYPARIDSRVEGRDAAGGQAEPASAVPSQRPNSEPRPRPNARPRPEPQPQPHPEPNPADVQTLADLAGFLRALRRRHGRRQGTAEPTYRELAAATGWSHGIIGEYLAGRILPPTDRFDVLIRLLGATAAEQGALATARDRVEEGRRRSTPTRNGSASGTPAPRQLPLGVFGFTGRAEELAEMDSLLGQPVRICAVAGTAGVGKTALAVRWAHRVADRFPDGQLYLDLRGYDPGQPVAPADALGRLLRGLGVEAADIPNDLAERSARYRSVLADRRVLVVLDNVSGADQVRPLLPGAPSCFVLVTSRDDLAGLVAREGARRIGLGTLTAAESAELLRTLIGARVDEDAQSAASLAERCLRLPLALRIAAELATAHPATTLADLLADLRDEQQRLDLLDATGDARTSFRSVFSWSYRHLSAEGARAFGLLGLHPAREIEPYAVAALTDLGLDQARALVGELARAHLIEPSGAGGYAMHDLLRTYAVERAHAVCPPDVRHAALSRLFDHYLYTAGAAMDTLFPHERGSRPETPPLRTPAPRVDDRDRAMRWLDEQRASLVAVAVYAARNGWPQHSIDLSCTLWRAFEVGGHYQEALAVHTSAASAADEHGYDGADVLANLGGIHWWLGNHRRAQAYFEQSLHGHRHSGDQDGEARALARLGLVYERLGDYRAALTRLRDALAIYRRTGNRHGEGSQLVNIGTLHRRLGDYAQAAEHHRQAAAVFVEIGEPRLEGYALGNLGAVYNLLGRHAEALAHLEQALSNCRLAGDRGGEGSALGTIGAIYGRWERYPQALDHLHRALAISRETGDRSLETETLNTLGETLRALREPQAALARHRDALASAEQAGDRFECARALDGIAEALNAAGRRTEARDHWRRALTIYLSLGVPEARQVRARLAGDERRR
jgi:tetratricopeptide (TPR) repeat protein/transcriptional regulator with XRE-family HTH domain